MRSTRRWTDSDLQSLAHRDYGLVSAPAPPLSAEATAIRLAKLRATRAKLESVFEQHLTWTGMRAIFDKHVRFHPTRKWELDYLAKAFSLGIEIHGGIFSAGRHTTGTGFENDRAKMNAAHELGITVLEFTGAMLTDGTAIAQTERVLRTRGWSRGGA
jgi:hypothetical protein